MDTMPRRVLVDKDLRPAYYDDFHCLMSDCKLSCCVDKWQIPVSKKQYLTLKRQKGSPELNEQLKNGIRRIRRGNLKQIFYGEINMDSGVCPMLRDGLCGLQIEKGPDVLPETCRTYPRKEQHMFSGYLERSLSPSCEGVLELLWNLPEGIDFRSDPLPKEKQQWMVLKEDQTMSLWFTIVREWCIDLLQNRKFSLPERIWLMGMGLNRLAEGETDIGHWMEWAAALPKKISDPDLLPTGNQKTALFIGNCIHTFIRFPSTDDIIRQIQEQILKDEKQGTHFVTYSKAQKRYDENFRNQDYFMENLMVSIFFYLNMPDMKSREDLWKSYVNFCNLYSIYRFLSVMSCRDGAAGDKKELFKLIVFASRVVLHDMGMQAILWDKLFQHDNTTLAHMAILLSG